MMSEKWCCMMWIITKFNGSTPVCRPLCSKPRRKFVQTSCSEITVHWPHFCRWQLRPMFSQSHLVSSKSHNICTSNVPSVKRTLVESGIQGHLYWCRQKSWTVCHRNVQLMPTLFLKLAKIWQQENCKFVDINTPLQFDDAPARNAFEYLQIYIARN